MLSSSVSPNIHSYFSKDYFEVGIVFLDEAGEACGGDGELGSSLERIKRQTLTKFQMSSPGSLWFQLLTRRPSRLNVANPDQEDGINERVRNRIKQDIQDVEIERDAVGETSSYRERKEKTPRNGVMGETMRQRFPQKKHPKPLC